MIEGHVMGDNHGDKSQEVDRKKLSDYVDTCTKEELKAFVVRMIDVSPWAESVIRLTCQLCLINKAGTFRVKTK